MWRLIKLHAFLIVSPNHRHKTAANLKQNDAFISLATLCGKRNVGWVGVVFVLVTVHKRGVLGVKIRPEDVSTGAVKVRNYITLLPRKIRKGGK
jgi:hypothetical protein